MSDENEDYTHKVYLFRFTCIAPLNLYTFSLIGRPSCLAVT